MKSSLKKIVLIVLCGGVILAVLSAWFHSSQKKKLQQELSDTRAALRAQGFKTDLDDFKVVTDDATRARLAALTALHCWPQLDVDGNRLNFLPLVSNGVA